MADHKWKLEKDWKAKRQGQVWIVKSEDGRRGYFKFAYEEQWHYAGTLVANEYIVAELAKKLGFPVSRLIEAEVKGRDGNMQKGIVSHEVIAEELFTWQDAPPEIHERPEKYVKHTNLLRTLVVFDAWTCNVDRATGKNLILYRKKSAKTYNWYLIDHGLALYGSPNKWAVNEMNSDYWNCLWKYHHVPKGLARLSSSAHVLEPMIKKIEALRESDIDEAISKVPKGYLRDKERDLIKRLLLNRQRRLRGIIGQWLSYRGIKEYRGV